MGAAFGQKMVRRGPRRPTPSTRPLNMIARYRLAMSAQCRSRSPRALTNMLPSQVRLGTGWRLCVLVYCALAYCAAGDNTMVRIDASKVDVRAFTRRALNLGESDEITC